TLFSPNQVSPNQVAGRTDGDSVKNSVKNSANNREGTKKADSKKDRVASSTTTYADSDATPEEQRDVLPPLDPENDPYAGLFDRPASYRHPSLPGELSYEYAPSVPKTPVDEQTIADYESAGHEVIVPGGSRGEGSRGNTHPEAPLPSSELALRSTLSPAISDMPAKPDMREVPNRIEGGRVESEVESSGRRVSWDTVPLQSQLPAVVLVEFPELHYSSHIYSSDPRFRSVTINERVFRERDQVEPRVRVVEITEQGVIMQFDEVRFKVALLDQWLE
ncbi:MAG: general secretion pathway protein GspB, partial [Gammaproteobacteria bacterium]